MKSPAFVLLRLAVALLLFAASPPASAGAAARLAYDAPADCVRSSDFVAAVETRGGRFAPSESTEATMQVVIRKADQDFVGTLRVHDSEGSKTEVSCYKHDLVTVVEIALKDTSTPHLVEEYVRDRISAVTQGSMGAHSGGYRARQMNVAEELRVRGVIT